MFNKRQRPFLVQNASGLPLVHNLTASNSDYKKNVMAGAVIVIFGLISGYYLSNGGRAGLINKGATTQNEGSANSAVGSSDTKTFRDSAEGELKPGGINGEGTHSLIRPGGESQTVALTSSVLDMSKFEGKKVKVWGETFAGQSAGWYMDVGKIEVIK